MGHVKIVLAYKQGNAKLTTLLKSDEHTSWPDIIRAADWQANLCGITGGPQLIGQEIRPVLSHKLYYRGATQTVTEMP